MNERVPLVDGDPVSRLSTETGGAAPIAPPAVVAPFGALSLLDAEGAMRPLQDIEAEAIRFAIAHYQGHMSEVARRLRIGRSTLYRKLDALRLEAEISDDKTCAWYLGDSARQK